MNKLDNFCTEHSKSCKNINNCVSVLNKILTVSHLKENLLQLSIRNRNTTALDDTGASVSCISEDFCFQIFPNLYQNLANNPVIGEPKFKAIRGVCGETHPVRGTIELEVNVNGFRISQSFHIFSRLQNTVILGLDFLKANKAKIDLGEGSISFFEGAVHAPLIAKISDTQHAVMAYSVVLKPRSQTVISVKVPKTFDENLVLIDTTAGNHHSKYITAKCVTPVYGQYAQCMVLNPSNAPFHLKQDTMIGQVYDLDDSFDITDIDCDENVQSVSRVETDNNDFPQTQDLGDIPQDLNIDLSNSDLDEHQKQRLLQFIARNRKVFANNLSELGSTSVYKHKIETTDDIPVRSRHYRMSKEMKDLVENEIDQMLKHKIIEPSTTEWTSPIVMVKKKTVGYRMAADLRKLNSKCKPIQFPLPRAEDIFDTIGQAKAKYMSILDCFSGYWQIELDPETKHKAGIITHHGVWEWNKLPFGLVSAPAAFQKTMATVLRDLNWKQVLIYVDDILVMSESFDQHLHHLQQVFDRLIGANLTLKPSKCQFAAKEVTYLGYVISKDGIKTDPSKTEVIQTYPTPKTQKQLRQAMGLFNFYRRFVKGFSQIAAPLNSLLSKDMPFQWSEECEIAFQTLKANLTQAPILGYPNMSLPFTLTTDASGSGLGYILSQEQSHKKEVVIAYGGRGLKTGEKNYSALECLAVLEGIRAYHPYLSNTQFKVITDHYALLWLHKTKKETGRLSRWAIQLQGYNYKVEHRKGTKNTNADALSRREYPAPLEKKPEDSWSADATVCSTKPINEQWTEICIHSDLDTEEVKDILVVDKNIVDYNNCNPADMSKIAELQRECADCKPYIQYKEEDILPSNPQQAQKIEATSDHFILIDGVLYRQIVMRNSQRQESPKIVLPKALRAEALKAYHDSPAGGAHQGVHRTTQALKTKYWIPHINEFVKSYVDSCDVCQKIKRSYLPKVPLHPMPVETECFNRIHMDILGPLPEATDKSKYILLVVDSLSKWPEAFSLPNQEAVTIARTLYKEVFTRYGAIKSIVSDRGRNFMSKVVSALCELFQTKRMYTSAFHPQTNSHCERYNSFIAQSLRAYIGKDQNNWPELLPGILMAFRLTPAGSSGISPFHMLFGKDMKLPFDLDLEPKSNLGKEAQDCVAQWFHNLHIAKETAQANIKRSQQEYKRY